MIDCISSKNPGPGGYTSHFVLFFLVRKDTRRSMVKHYTDYSHYKKITRWCCYKHRSECTRLQYEQRFIL